MTLTAAEYGEPIDRPDEPIVSAGLVRPKSRSGRARLSRPVLPESVCALGALENSPGFSQKALQQLSPAVWDVALSGLVFWFYGRKNL